MVEIVKAVVPHLSAHLPETRADAQALLTALFKQCSDPTAVKTASEIHTTALKSKL